MPFQQLTLIGHIGQDAQTRTLDGGRVVTSFSVAYSEQWKNAAGEKQERTTWFNCSYFTATTPGVAEYLRRGSLICITGKVSARAYLGNNNQPAASLELNVDTIKLLSTLKRDEQPATTPMPPADTEHQQSTVTAPNLGDDLPF
jgi:single-strand DNA-binding protein